MSKRPNDQNGQVDAPVQAHHTNQQHHTITPITTRNQHNPQHHARQSNISNTDDATSPLHTQLNAETPTHTPSDTNITEAQTHDIRAEILQEFSPQEQLLLNDDSPLYGDIRLKTCSGANDFVRGNQTRLEGKVHLLTPIALDYGQRPHVNP